MKASELLELIKSRNTAKIYRPIMVESSPGIGKTQIAAQAAKELGVDFKVIHAPLLQPEDYGLPAISADKSSVEFLVSSEKFPLLNSLCGERGILLIDELSQCDNSAQKINANLMQAREIHGKKIKGGWTIVATGNRASDRSGANRLLGHLGNRVTRVELETSLDDWTQWALANNVKTEVIAFLRFRPELLSQYNPQNEVNATPRAWVEGVSASLGSVPAGLEFSVFKGDVGEGPASEFLAFLKIFRNLPSPDAILMDPMKAKVPTDPATLYAICGALAARSTPDNIDRAFSYIRRLPKEFSVLFIRDAIQRNENLVNTKTYIDWASKEGAELLS